MRQRILPLLIFLFIVISLQSSLTSCTGQMEITVLSFENPQGTLRNDQYCDWWDECDIYFRVCVKFQPKILQPIIDCSGNKGYKSDIIKNASRILIFGKHHYFGNGFTNPLIFSFEKWNEGYISRFIIYDDDTGVSYDVIDSFTTIKVFPGELRITSKNKTKEEFITYIGSRHIKGAEPRLNISIRVYCDQDYYGRDCTVFCKPTERYNCNSLGLKQRKYSTIRLSSTPCMTMLPSTKIELSPTMSSSTLVMATSSITNIIPNEKCAKGLNKCIEKWFRQGGFKFWLIIGSCILLSFIVVIGCVIYVCKRKRTTRVRPQHRREEQHHGLKLDSKTTPIQPTSIKDGVEMEERTDTLKIQAGRLHISIASH